MKKQDSLSIPDSIGSSSSSFDTSFRFSDIISSTNPIRSKELEESKTYIPLFKHHELTPKNQTPVPINNGNPFWLIYVLILLIAGFTWVKVYYYRTLEQIITSFFSKTIANQVVRDENLLLQKASFLLTTIFYLVITLFLYELNNLYSFLPDFFGSGFSRILILGVLVSLVYSIKFIVLKLTGIIFHLDKAFSTYIFNIFLIHNLLGILLIPVVIALAFTTTAIAIILFKISLLIVIILFIFRLIRGVMIGLSLPGFSAFYLILYICGLEIAPLLVFIKVLV